MSGLADVAAPVSTAGAAAPVVSRFEFWPGWLFHAPIVVQWIALGLRFGDMSLPTAANPGIELGGLCGESKTDILDQLAPAARDLAARHVRVIARPGMMGVARQALAAAGIVYPLVAKPDIGCNGTGVRLVRDEAALGAYVAEFPLGAALMLQEYIPFEGEAGLFWIRHPDEAQGRITSLTLKSSPVVVGDGRRTLRQLVLDDPRAGRVPELYLPRLGARAAGVPRSGERVPLVFVGNHCKGALFRDGAADITPALTEAVGAIAAALPGFHFGRLDVRFASLAALRRGEGFKVIEINGVGSEATHVWDPACTLRAAWAAQFAHYRAAFDIGRALRARGARPAGLRAMARGWLRQRRLMARYPMND